MAAGALVTALGSARSIIHAEAPQKQQQQLQQQRYRSPPLFIVGPMYRTETTAHATRVQKHQQTCSWKQVTGRHINLGAGLRPQQVW